MTSRTRILIGAGIPVLLLVGLLVWGTASTGGKQGRPGVNDTFGEIAVSVAPAKDLEVTTVDGRSLKLSDLRGKVVMVDFWSSWCAPCIAEGPMLASAYDEWRSRGVEFVGIAIWDDVQDVNRFIVGNAIKYQVAIDAKGEVAINYGVKGVPEKYFITSDGMLAKKVIGPMTRAKLDGILDALSIQSMTGAK